jgi:hypothetical protein
MAPGKDRQPFLLNERGFYEFRSKGAAPGEAVVVAVNVDPLETNLAALDPAEFARTVSDGPAASHAGGLAALGPEDRERRQSIWWYALALGALALAAENVLARRLSRPAAPQVAVAAERT